MSKDNDKLTKKVLKQIIGNLKKTLRKIARLGIWFDRKVIEPRNIGIEFSTRYE